MDRLSVCMSACLHVCLSALAFAGLTACAGAPDALSPSAAIAGARWEWDPTARPASTEWCVAGVARQGSGVAVLLPQGILPTCGGVPRDAMLARDAWPNVTHHELAATGYYPRLHLLPDGGSVARVSELPSAALSIFNAARER
jgi:hypothetical protein